MTQQQQELKDRLVELMRRGAWLPHHDCGACAAWVHYFMEEDRLYFDSNCSCSRFVSQPRLCSLGDIDHMVCQSNWAKQMHAWALDQERHYGLSA